MHHPREQLTENCVTINTYGDFPLNFEMKVKIYCLVVVMVQSSHNLYPYCNQLFTVRTLFIFTGFINKS